MFEECIEVLESGGPTALIGAPAADGTPAADAGEAAAAMLDFGTYVDIARTYASFQDLETALTYAEAAYAIQNFDPELRALMGVWSPHYLELFSAQARANKQFENKRENKRENCALSSPPQPPGIVVRSFLPPTAWTCFGSPHARAPPSGGEQFGRSGGWATRAA